MAKVKVQLRLAGINQLMTSAPVQAEVDARAKRIAEAAGPNFESTRGKGRSTRTARAYIQPANAAGMREEARHKRLTGALDAAG